MTVNKKIDQTGGILVTLYHVIVSNNLPVYFSKFEGGMNTVVAYFGKLGSHDEFSRKKILVTLRLEFEPVTPECKSGV